MLEELAGDRPEGGARDKRERWSVPSRSTSSRAPDSELLDQLIRPSQQRRRNRQTEGLGSLEVDDQVELRDLLDGEIGRPSALQDARDVDGSVRHDGLEARAIRHQA